MSNKRTVNRVDQLSYQDFEEGVHALGWDHPGDRAGSKRASVKKALCFLESTKKLELDMNSQYRVINSVNYALDDNDLITHVIQLISELDDLDQNVRNQLRIKENKIKKTIRKALSKSEANVDYDIKSFQNSLVQNLKIAINQYRDLNHGGVSPIRLANVRALRAIINTSMSDDQLEKSVRSYLDRSDFNANLIGQSRLKSLMIRAINKYIREGKDQGIRTLHVKEWVNLAANPTKKNVVLAIPGLGDSVDTFNRLAPMYADKGYQVISYDQAGQGYDKLRRKNGALNLNQMQYDFYYMLNSLLQDPQVENITLIGHSLGGAMIAHALPTLKNMKKIKHIELLAPATMKNPVLQLLGNLWTLITNPSDMTEGVHIERIKNAGLKRIGGNGVTAGVFFKFRSFLENAFYNLLYAFNNTDYGFSMAVHYDVFDGLVSRSNFELMQRRRLALPPNSGSVERVRKVYTYAGGKHHFHYHNAEEVKEYLHVNDELPDTDDSLEL
jgi:pimeloyl-ACP methyl ester carboxylesterase